MNSLQIFLSTCLFTSGLWMLFASLYDWKIFFDFSRVQSVTDFFFNGNKKYTRIFYGFLGVLMIFIVLINLVSVVFKVDHPFLHYFLFPAICKNCSSQRRLKSTFVAVAVLVLFLGALFFVFQLICYRKQSGYTFLETYTTIFVVIINIGGLAIFAITHSLAA